ncbi:MAG: tetratricopeptide repeat protein [Alphaproteobacteria bacterium]|nr:tetratricopeptide repeat protein [Alphaproteobacteria bacterium]
MVKQVKLFGNLRNLEKCNLHAYNQAIGLEPNDAAVWCSLGILYYSHGQNQEAESCTRRAVRLDPHMAEAWYNLGVLCDAAKNSREAILFPGPSWPGLTRPSTSNLYRCRRSFFAWMPASSAGMTKREKLASQ